MIFLHMVCGPWWQVQAELLASLCTAVDGGLALYGTV